MLFYRSLKLNGGSIPDTIIKIVENSGQVTVYLFENDKLWLNSQVL